VSELLVLGLSHRTAPLQLREAVALTEGRAAAVMSELAGGGSVSEAAVLSTCNRTEIYLVASDPVEAVSLALAALARQAGTAPTGLAGHLYSLAGREAADHLFRVAAGLESMVLGEAEILGQVRRAHELALVEGASGPILGRLFHGAAAAAGRARDETAIGRSRVSVPSVSVDIAAQAVGDLNGREVVVIGTGDTAALLGRSLADRGADVVFVANRHFDKAEDLASRFGGRAARIDELPALLGLADVFFSATASPHHVIEAEDLGAAARDRQLLLIDLAVPRDIGPGCRDIEGVTLRDIDDVQAVAERNAGSRAAAAVQAARILESELDRFEAWLAALEVAPAISALRARGDEVTARVLAENRDRWKDLSDEDRERVEAMVRNVATRLLHSPTRHLREVAGSDRAYETVSALRELFDLDVDTASEGESRASVTPIRRKTEG
jgi:glutamyl-tRNA reductase